MAYINEGEKALREFCQEAESKGYEVFTSKQIREWVNKSLIASLDDEKERREFSLELNSFTRQIVVNDDLTKSILYFRPPQIIWDRVDSDSIMKSKTGVYADTPMNRKLGRVGLPYGKQDNEDGGEKEKDNLSSKKDDKKNLNAYKNLLSKLQRDFQTGDGIYKVEEKEKDSPEISRAIQEGYAKWNKEKTGLESTNKEIPKNENVSDNSSVYPNANIPILPNLVLQVLKFLESKGVDKDKVKNIHDEILNALKENNN